MRVLLTLLVVLAASAAAQEPGNPSLGQITVEAERDRAVLERKVDTFVSHVAVKVFETSLARWREPICPLIAGVPREEGEFMLERLSRIATEVRAPLAGEHCKPNFWVLLSAQPTELVRAWLKQNPHLLGDGGARRFLNGNEPVRIWYNMVLGDADGAPILSSSPGLTSSGAQEDGNSAFSGVPQNSHATATRLAYNDLRAMHAVIVLIDARQMGGISFGQITAYVAVGGMAQVHLNADIGEAPSILSLFTRQTKAPAGLSAWDEAYLKSLYQTSQSDVSQVGAMRLSVLDQLTHSAAPAH